MKKPVPIKIAVLSDIHGNLPALQAVLDDLEDFKPDEFIFAGDFTRGPHPDEVIGCLRERNAHMILGNDDRNLLGYLNGEMPDEWRSRKQMGSFRWTARRLSPENLRFLQSLPEQRSIVYTGAGSIRVVHGSPEDPVEPIRPDLDMALLDRYLEQIPETVLVCGHTHRQWSTRRNGKLGLNPGAVASTRIGPYAQYARLAWQETGWSVEGRTTPYDVAALRTTFVESGLLEEGGPLARGFLLAMETGRDYMMQFLAYAHHMAAQAGCDDCPVLPDAIWDRANASFDWS